MGLAEDLPRTLKRAYEQQCRLKDKAFSPVTATVCVFPVLKHTDGKECRMIFIVNTTEPRNTPLDSSGKVFSDMLICLRSG